MALKERRELEIFLLETPQQEIAQSLNAHHYQLNSRDRDSFRKTLFQIYDCVHSWPVLDGQDLAEHILAHENEINEIFDDCPIAWRFPIYIDIDLYSTFRHHIDDGKKIFQHIMQSWQWYAFFRAKKSELAFYKTAHIFNGTPHVQAQQFIDTMIKGVWGSMQNRWISSLGLGNVCDKYESEAIAAAHAFVNSCSDGGMGFKKAVITAAKSSDLPFEILFIYNNCFGARPEDYVDSLNFLLCQKDMYSYRDILTYTTYDDKDGENIIPVWCHWVGRYFPDIMSPGTPHRALFDFAFSLDDAPLIKDGRVLTCHKRKEGTKGLPPLLIKTIENCYPKYRESVGRVRRSISRVATKTTETLAIPITSASVSAGQIPQKKTIDVPSLGIVLIPGGEKKQLKGCNLAWMNFPEGTEMKLERQLPKSKIFETIPVEMAKNNEIKPILGREIKGHFLYRLTITLPGEYRFPDGKTKTILEHKIYAEADPTPEEIEAQKNKKTAPIQPVLIPQKTASSLAPAVKTAVTSVLETPLPKQKSIADTMTAWELAIQEGSITPELRDDGVIIFHLSDEFVDELHDASFEVLQISPDSTIHPDIGVGDFASQLQDIARELREKKQAEYDLALQAEQEEKEYQMLREQFQPFYDFIGEQTFVDKNNKALFDKASEGFKISLKSLGWSMPWRITKDGQIQFRHTRNDIKITYSNLGLVMHVVGEKRTLSKAEERCYREIAEAFSHLALFYTADYRERQSMISKEKKFQKDMRQGAEAYEELLREGKARLVQYYSGDKGSIFVTKFPLDDRPHMLPEKVGRDTVEEALQKNEHSELCYRRDILRINGEIDEDAEEQSVENALQNLNDLRQSPRARYILRKRILITLDYEKFSGDDTRRAIQPEKNGRKKTSAYEILQSLKIEKNIESKEQIDDEFMDAYIDLLIKHRIRVQYVWPLSVSLKTHREQL